MSIIESNRRVELRVSRCSRIWTLVCGILAIAGLLLSFFVRRRRVFVRAVTGPDGVGSVVTVGGLTRTDASGGFEDEFATLAADIADVSAADPNKPEPNNKSETGA